MGRKESNQTNNDMALLYLQSFSCFLLDNHGYVLASKTPESDVGKFFGEVDGQVMTYLVMFHNLFVG